METAWYFSNAKNYETLHDLEAPLQALGAFIKNLSELPRPKRLELHRMVERMETILRPPAEATPSETPLCNVRSILVDAVLEKRASATRAQLELELHIGEHAWAAIAAEECARVLSNCLDHFLLAQNNAPKTIRITLTEDALAYRVEIRCPVLTRPKSSLPLHLASTKIQAWGGSIHAEHTRGIYLLSLSLPKSNPTKMRAG